MVVGALGKLLGTRCGPVDPLNPAQVIAKVPLYKARAVVTTMHNEVRASVAPLQALLLH